MSFLDPSPADTERRRGLRRMRVVATSLLVVAAIIYLLTLGRVGAWGYVNTASEAAMVGALADWFAVTALFKHPLGLPIPHTALVRRRKDELGRSLEEFVTENFLTEEIARERLAAAQVGLRLGRWLGEPSHRERVLVEGVRVGRAALGRMRDEDVRGFVEDVMLPRLVREPLSAVAGTLLEEVVADRAHHGLVDLAVEQLHAWLVENPSSFHDVMAERAPWWTPDWMDERVITWGHRQAADWLADVRTDGNHPARLALDDLLARLARDLQHDPSVMERAEALKVTLLQHPQVGDTVVSLWQSVRSSLLTAMDDRSSGLWSRGDAWLAEFGERLVSDVDFRGTLEGHLGDVIAFVVNTYAGELATVISATVDRWDGREAAERIELFVGRDLQFIRINGTIVGALAGVLIHAVSQLAT